MWAPPKTVRTWSSALPTQPGLSTKDGEVHECKFCGYDGTGAMIGARVVCQYCKEADAILHCSICGDNMLRSDAIVWNDDQEGHTDYACEACDDRIRAMGRD